MLISKFIKASILILCLIIFLSEIKVRLVPLFKDYPEKSLFVESRRLSYSNLRTCPEVTEIFSSRIQLPEKEKKDILVLGDSFPFGFNVKSDNTFPSILQKITGKKIVNLGLAAKGPLQYNRMLEVGMQYDPDTIINCIFTNDFPYFDDVKI